MIDEVHKQHLKNPYAYTTREEEREGGEQKIEIAKKWRRFGLRLWLGRKANGKKTHRLCCSPPSRFSPVFKVVPLALHLKNSNYCLRAKICTSDNKSWYNEWFRASTGNRLFFRWGSLGEGLPIKGKSTELCSCLAVISILWLVRGCVKGLLKDAARNFFGAEGQVQLMCY